MKNGTQPNFAKQEEVNGADASRIRWRRIVNVNVTIEIRSLSVRGPNTFQVSNGIALGGLQWQYIVNFCNDSDVSDWPVSIVVYNLNNRSCVKPLTDGKMSRASAMCPFRTRVKHS